jgi:hypothetical protein
MIQRVVIAVVALIPGLQAPLPPTPGKSERLLQLERQLSDNMRELGSVIVRMNHPNPLEYQALTIAFDTAFRTVDRVSAALKSKKRIHQLDRVDHGRRTVRAYERGEVASQCRLASGAWTAESPSIGRTFSHIGVGMMVPPLLSKTLEFLRCATETWMPVAGPTLNIVMLADCRNTNASLRRIVMLSAPQLPTMHPRCYFGKIEINVNDFDKEAALLDELLQALPGKSFYLTVDMDTMVMPSNLLKFISLHPGGLPLYYGSDEISTRISRCPRCFLNSGGWISAVRHFSHLAGSPGLSTPSTVTYAQGGAKGFSHSALQLLVRSGCLRHVGSLPCHDGLCIHKKEDATVGLCMLALGIPLTNCRCFHAWGPCNIYNTTSCHDHDAKARLCRYPITIHKLKRLDWYRRWWYWLNMRG